MPEDLLEAAHRQLARAATRLDATNLSPILEQEDGTSEFTVEVTVGGEPVSLRFVVPVSFPHGEVEVFAASTSWQGYPHQSSEAKLCPKPPKTGPARDETRLVQVVDAACEWLRAAVAGTLSPDGEPYELPDFPRSDETPTLHFEEDADSFVTWRDRVGTSGVAKLLEIDGGCLASSFNDSEDATIARSDIDRGDGRAVQAHWMLLPTLAVDRHRPARTWSELVDLVPELEHLVFRAWKAAPKGGVPARVDHAA